MIADVPVNKNCWNVYESYGEICIRCGCCSKEKNIRYESRLKVLNRLLCAELDFDFWSEDEGVRALQKETVKRNIKSLKRAIRYYENKLETDTNVGHKKVEE